MQKVCVFGGGLKYLAANINAYVLMSNHRKVGGGGGFPPFPFFGTS